MDSFTTPVNIEVQYASEAVIAAIERVGGVITTRYYDLLSVMAKSNPYRFFEMGLPIPRGKKPPLVSLLSKDKDACSSLNTAFYFTETFQFGYPRNYFSA